MRKCLFSHGDVNFFEVKEIPKGYKKIELYEGFIVEKGDGPNTHVLENVEDCVGYKNEFGNLLLEIKGLKTVVNHEEHNKISFKPGIYIKDIENEFDYEAFETRKTQD